MRCRFCDSELPQGALFCGECGRAVSAAPSAAIDASHPIAGRPLTVPAAPEPGLTVATGPDGGVNSCEQCGSALAPTDIFCGECGFITRVVDARDTLPYVDDSPADSTGGVTVPPSETPAEDSAGGGEAQSPTETSGEDSASRAAAQPRIEIPRAEPVASDAQPARFVLQFSTGEAATVEGTGLIGRNPRPEPGEFFDQLVTVSDASRSVSKTHLEFGQDAGEFWVRDRYSGNGTQLRAPDAPVVHLIPDRRYRVPRGSRVDVGDQFFVVS